MGDNGKLYVPKELIPIYQQFILPIATILTPNLFEIELLTDIKITREEDIWEAIAALHSAPVKLKLQIPKLPASFTGSGDLFSALTLCLMQQTGSDLKLSLEKTVATLQAVLKRTLEFAKGKEVNPRNMELRLIQSRDDILNPKVLLTATVIDGS
ncbi:hypothetical protein HUJ05_004069 [Dendroctonus ponderosae]|nr:hypothetical protein HUJ05_004069 [Dendroctonus ponderosae]